MNGEQQVAARRRRARAEVRQLVSEFVNSEVCGGVSFAVAVVVAGLPIFRLIAP
jgi:hypothetical protein